MRSRAFALVRRQPIALLALFVALGGTSFAAARSGDGSQDVIHGCIADGNGRLRIVDPGSRCGTHETAISFNREGRRGPQGRAGHTGARGPAGSKGDPGLAGADGHDGAAGADGHDGKAGLDALITTADEPAADNCATGGTKLNAGLDADRDGTLDPSEVNSALTRYVCHGATGERGPAGKDIDASNHFTKAETDARYLGATGKAADADRLDGADLADLAISGDLLFARVASNGTTVLGSRPASVTAVALTANAARVTFARNVAGCAFAANEADGSPSGETIAVAPAGGGGVDVTFQSTLHAFDLQVIC
jgi:Collagen triple helix repeat (20 copies)